jgi:hypothetical protein
VPASVLRRVAGAIHAALSAITVAGGYHYSLNGTDQVVYGIAAAPALPGQATAFIALEQVATTTGPELTRWSRAASYRVEALVPSDETPGKQQLDAMDLLDDIVRAIEADRSLGLRAAGVRDILLDGTAFAGSLIQFGAYGIASIRIDVKLNVATGA